jgi:hypothetical protein
MNTKILSVRVEEPLYTKCIQHDLPRRELITKALNQYFRSKEPNKKIDNEPYTNVYNKELVEHLQQEINFLHDELQRVHNELQATMMIKTPLLQRVILRLQGSR